MSDLSDLMAKDPLELTTTDLEDIIKKMRDSRKQFMLGNMRAGNVKPPSAKQTQGLQLAKALKLSLGDL